MDDDLAEQVDGLDIDDDATLEGRTGRKVTSGATLLEQVRIKRPYFIFFQNL